MEGLIYPATLAIIAILAFIFYQNHNMLLMAVVIVIGAYIVYSHETGYTATEFKNNMVESINSEAEDFSKEKGTQGYDANKAVDSVK